MLPVSLHILHAIKSNSAVWLEGYLHRAFCRLRVRGEWFRLADEDVIVLTGFNSASCEDDVPEVIRLLHSANVSQSAKQENTDRKTLKPVASVPAVVEVHERVVYSFTVENVGDWISLAQAARVIGCTKRNALNYVLAGSLPATSIDGFWVVLRKHAESFKRPARGRPKKA